METRPSEFETICTSCAAALQPDYPPGLVHYVRASLSGGGRGGRADQMGLGVSMADAISLGQLMVAMLGVAVTYLTVRDSRAQRKATAEPRFQGDVDQVEAALDEAIADLGSDQQAEAKRLKDDICRWLKERSSE